MPLPYGMNDELTAWHIQDSNFREGIYTCSMSTRLNGKMIVSNRYRPYALLCKCAALPARTQPSSPTPRLNVWDQLS